MPTSRVPASALSTACSTTVVSPSRWQAAAGTVVPAGWRGPAPWSCRRSQSAATPTGWAPRRRTASRQPQCRGVVEGAETCTRPLLNGEMTRARGAEAQADGPAMPGRRRQRPGQVLPCCPGRRGGRRHVVEEAAVLVVDHDEHGLAQTSGLDDEGVEDLLDEVLAVLRRRGRVLALGERRHDPRHGGQGAGRRRPRRRPGRSG